jgi:sarcosine oxidase delta subunit
MEKWIKCRGCRKYYTLTFHKKKTSVAICPHCKLKRHEEVKLPSHNTPHPVPPILDLPYKMD